MLAAVRAVPSPTERASLKYTADRRSTEIYGPRSNTNLNPRALVLLLGLLDAACCEAECGLAMLCPLLCGPAPLGCGGRVVGSARRLVTPARVVLKRPHAPILHPIPLVRPTRHPVLVDDERHRTWGRADAPPTVGPAVSEELDR